MACAVLREHATNAGDVAIEHIFKTKRRSSSACRDAIYHRAKHRSLNYYSGRAWQRLTQLVLSSLSLEVFPRRAF